ncbi:MAG: hypothetical protein QGG05_12945, partial [Candidatus Latescibacteria bacterium]|nr:hypothetical protein [Candidatus Latescibacterota bacterium]
MIDKAGVALGVHQMHFPDRPAQASRIPITGSCVASSRHIGIAQGQSACTGTDGEEFAGEGILAITKALLQSGVAYVGGYQGSPISHLMDVLSD